jgi:hypothetical protein
MADKELEYIISDVTEEDYDQASSGFVSIPPRDASKGLQAGDSVVLEIETGPAVWKVAGKSLTVPVTVTSKGENFGKTTEIYPGVTHDPSKKADALSILKALCKNLGVEKKVITFNDRKQMVIKPNGFEGGKGKGRFIATWTVPQESGKNPSLVAKLSTVDIFPMSYGASAASVNKDNGVF